MQRQHGLDGFRRPTGRVPHRGGAALAALALAGALALTGCSAGADTAAPATADRAAQGKPQEAAAPGKPGAGADSGAAAPPAAAGSKEQQPAVRPQLIRTATLGIETKDAQAALAAARTAAEGAGGYVGNESTRRDKDGRITSTLTLRVPSERFDAVIGALEGSGKLLSRKVEAQDVTEKVADIDSRVASQRASVARVRDMMGRASALNDVVMLENELSKRQSDLESLLAQQTALKDRTSLGTITLEVSEPAPPPVVEEEEKEKEATFLSALGGGWRVFTKLLRYLTVAVGAVLPFAGVAAVGLLGFRAYRRVRPAKPKTGPVAPPRPVPAARKADAGTAAAATTSETPASGQD
jgi:hypothetical protein